jgi:hypothetical protein
MGSSKVIKDFSSGRYSDPELSVKASHVIEHMTDNPHFTTPIPPLADLAEANGAYIQALNKAEGGSKEDTVIKNNYRKLVESLLKRETDYVQTTSEGDEAIILSSGFDVNKKPAVIGPLPKATGLSITPGDNKGTVLLNCNIVPNADFYEFEYTAVPYTADSIWLKRTSTKHKILIEGLSSGKQYVFHVAGAGSDPSRNWSDEIYSFVL